jgi:hypothetical protein
MLRVLALQAAILWCAAGLLAQHEFQPKIAAGADDNEPAQAGPSKPAPPKPAAAKPANSELQKAFEEFRSVTREMGYRADSPKRVGRAGGSRNGWHGRLFEYLRNDFLDSVPHEITQRGGSKGLLRRNQFGFNVAGPVVIPGVFDRGRKTFFSLSYEGVRERIGRSYLRTIPTAAERGGDFSSVVDSAGSVLPVFDPNTTRLNPDFDPSSPVSTENLQYLRDPFPGNRIPQRRLDPEAQRMLALYPQPNASVGPFFQNNYTVVSPETNTANGMIGKIDQSFSDRHRVTFEYAFSNGLAGQARLFPTAADPLPADREYSSRRGSLDYIMVLSPQVVNTLSLDLSTSGTQNVAAAMEAASLPVIRFSPYLSMGRSSPVSRNRRNTYVLANGFSRKSGRHSVKLSAQWVHAQVHTFVPQYPFGNYNFSAGLTSLPGIVNTGHSFASFLLGGADSAEVSLVGSPSYFRRNSMALSMRDQYELTRSFTISVGVGLDITGPRTEKFNRISNIDLRAINPVNGRPGALVAAGRGGWGRGFQPLRIKPEPRLAVTWNPRGDSKNIVRLSYDRSYVSVPMYNGQWGTQGFNTYPTFISSNAQLEPAVTLAAGLPVSRQTLPDVRPEAANDTAADLLDDTGRQSMYQSTALTLERALPGAMVVTAGVAHADGKNLFVGSQAASPNAIPLAALAFRDRLNDQAFNRSLRPYPQFLNFDLNASWPLGRYWRDVSFLRVEKRASNGLTLNAYYEFSKQMDDYSGPYGTQDFYNRHNEWALTAGNNPHRLSLTYAYELPIGTSKAMFAFSDWRRYLADGWSVSGTTRVASGDPLALRPLFNNTGGVVTTLNVDAVPGVNPHVADPGPGLWFNPVAFAQPEDFSTGNASRTHPTLRGPGSQLHDISVSKRVPLGAERTVELSAAGFNFLNTANWNEPDTLIGSASTPNVNAGKIIGSTGGRVIQLGLRISF